MEEENKDKCLTCSNCCASCSTQNYIFKTRKGLDENVVRAISAQKNEPEWMLDYRLKALEYFVKTEMPNWGPDLSALNFQDLCFYLKPVQKQEAEWSNVKSDIKNTFDELGLPKVEKEFLGGLGAQYESETVYHNLKKEWEEQGVIFVDTDTALKKYPEIFKKYFGTVVPFDDNKFAALNSAVWSGGSFIYVPKGVKVTVPLQAYYRINAEQIGQFERTLIIADQDSQVSYIEGCTAPAYATSSLHSAVVEVIALDGARIKYYTIQNWSKNVYNLVTKRAVAHANSIIEWVDGNIGSGVTMKYPAVILKEEGAKTEILSLAIAGQKQIQDSGAKAIHLAPNTSSKILSKSISKDGGKNIFRGVVKVVKGANNCKAFMQCDGLLINKNSQADAYPYIEVAQKDATVTHEATISKIADDKIFYLMSRGVDYQHAQSLIVNGFISPFVKGLPVEYAIEINRLMESDQKGDF